MSRMIVMHTGVRVQFVRRRASSLGTSNYISRRWVTAGFM